MATWLKQSTAVDVKVGPFLDDTDGKTAETALTITQPDIMLGKNGGAFAQKNAAQTLSHESNGWYEVALDATDTNTLGILILQIHESGALPVWREFMVLPAAVYDALVSGSGNGVRADVQAIAANAITAASINADALTAAKIAADVSAEIVDALLARVIGGATYEAHTQFQTDALAATTVAAISDGVWDEARSGHVAAGSFGQALQAVRANALQSATSTTAVLDTGASGTDDVYNGLILIIVGGTGAGQNRYIDDYVGATKTVTINGAWATIPDATSRFIIIGV